MKTKCFKEAKKLKFKIEYKRGTPTLNNFFFKNARSQKNLQCKKKSIIYDLKDPLSQTQGDKLYSYKWLWQKSVTARRDTSNKGRAIAGMEHTEQEIIIT